MDRVVFGFVFGREESSRIVEVWEGVFFIFF